MFVSKRKYERALAERDMWQQRAETTLAALERTAQGEGPAMKDRGRPSEVIGSIGTSGNLIRSSAVLKSGKSSGGAVKKSPHKPATPPDGPRC